MRLIPGFAIFCIFVATSAVAQNAPVTLADAINNPSRLPKSVARDAVRHPQAELEFFGLKPNQTVLEIWPGSGYWTEILTPYLAAQGTYYVALTPDAPHNKPIQDMTKADPARFGKIQFTAFPAKDAPLAPDNSLDLVLTFRNLHNFMAFGFAETGLKSLYAALKPGGVLGVEDHRGHGSEAQDPKAANGYVQQAYAIKLIEAAGFKFDGSSEMNANPKDTGNWPKGVWTLPPTFAAGDQDHDKYAAIGEADNFVLKFHKP